MMASHGLNLLLLESGLGLSTISYESCAQVIQACSLCRALNPLLDTITYSFIPQDPTLSCKDSLQTSGIFVQPDYDNLLLSDFRDACKNSINQPISYIQNALATHTQQ